MKIAGKTTLMCYLAGQHGAIVAILNTFNALWSVFITFYAWNKFEFNMLQGNAYICIFSVNMLWEKCDICFTNCNK